MTRSLTDIASLVDEAYSTNECVGEGIDHSGGQAAYLIAHSCVQGFLCEAHVKFMVEQVIPGVRATLNEEGIVQCARCMNYFSTVDEFEKVYPL